MYLSFYSSFLFYILALISYKYYPNNFRLFPLIFFVLSTSSVLHHTRHYGEDYWDEIGILDILVVFLLGIILVFYYYKNIILWIMIICMIYIRYCIYKTKNIDDKSKLHFWMHIIAFVCIFALLLDFDLLKY